MRIQKLNFLIAAVIVLLWCGTACQTAQRPAALLPAGRSTAPALSATPATAAQPDAHAKTVPQTQTEPKSDPVAELIAQVEKEYKTGQDNYKAGHLEAAKENFDRAFNLLLASSLDVRTDERLQQEFDRVLDGINGLE
jgi:membrane-bound lytic murein transglycosylase D